MTLTDNAAQAASDEEAVALSATIAFDSDCQASSLPYSGRHRKAPPGMRAALRRGRRRAADVSSPPPADGEATFQSQQEARLSPAS